MFISIGNLLKVVLLLLGVLLQVKFLSILAGKGKFRIFYMGNNDEVGHFVKHNNLLILCVGNHKLEGDT